MTKAAELWVLAGGFGLVALALPGSAAADPAAGVVIVGVRKPGSGGGEGLPQMDPVTKVDLDTLALRVVERFDAQYGSPRTFTGVPLEALLDRIQKPAHADLALLHFGNGVVVPLPYRDRAVMRRLQPWVARGMHHIDTGMTTGHFEPVTHRLRGYFDIPVVKFAGNKLVVADRWHPEVPARAEKDLSPWVHVDSLVAIELVNAAAYQAMFYSEAKTRSGLALFQQSCQFCHGLRQVGAKFGPDFVEPVPVHRWQKPAKQLYWHVKYRARNAVAGGEMMPALSYMTEKEASAVWSWLRSAADQPPRSYQPGK